MKHYALVCAALICACSSPAQSEHSIEAPDAAPVATTAPSAVITPPAQPPPENQTTPVEHDAGPDGAPLTTPRVLTWSSPTPISPGVETGSCGAVSAPETRERWLVGWHSTLTFAHHVNLWLARAGVDVPTWCKSHDTSMLVFDASQPDLRVSAPGGGAIRIPAGATFAVDVHELNTTDQPQTVTVHIELDIVDDQPGPELFAGVLQAQQFSVPAGASETLSWSCSVPAGASIAWLSSHSHRFTDDFKIYADGAQVFESTNWAEPAQKTFAPALTPKSIGWSSHIVNTLTTTLSWGTPRDAAEMSNVWLYTLGARFDCETTKTTIQ